MAYEIKLFSKISEEEIVISIGLQLRVADRRNTKVGTLFILKFDAFFCTQIDLT